MASFFQQHWLLKIILTAVLYYFSTLIGQELTSSTNSASFFTPSSGIALGSLFLFGPLAIIGIVLGSLAHVMLLINDNNIALLLCSLIPALQAYITFKFFNSKLQKPSSFIIEGDTIRFFTLAPLFSLISASLSIAALSLTQNINEGYELSTFLTWWIGNAFGVLIATPLFLALFSHKNEWQQRRVSVGFSLIILMSITIIIMQDAVNREQQQLTQRLHQTNQSVNSEIENTLKQYEKNLQAINIFFLSTYHATPNEIKEFLRKLNLQKNDTVYGYGWFGFADLVNTKKDSQYGFYTLKPYQFELNEAPIRVIQDQFEECTIGSYLEVHKNLTDTFALYRNIEASISSIENLCASEHLGGVAYVDIDLLSLLQKIKNQLSLNHIDIELIGIKNNQTTQLLQIKDIFLSDPNESSFLPISESLITYKNTFWTLKLTGNKQYVSLYSNWSTWWLLLVSLLFTSLSAFGLLLLTAKKLQFETIVDKKTDQLQKINNQLSEQIKQQQQQEILIKMQSRILEMIARGEPLSIILNQLCLYTENQIFEGFASINTYDENNQKVELVASPTLASQNEQYFVDLDLNQDNPSVEALKTQTQQIVENINDSLSSKLDGTQSYWATPIVSPQNEVLGVLTITLANSRSPSTLEQELMNVAASLACISIEQHNNSKQLNKLSNAVKSSPNGIVITSIKGVIEYANPYFCDYIGVDEENVIGEYLSKFVQDANDNNKQEFDWDYSLSLGESQREYMGIKPNGDIYWCKQSIASMIDPLENSQHVLSIHQDLTDEHTTLKFLKQQASHDSLTGLFNQTEFEYQINKLISNASPTNIHTVAYLDLDNFKSINEQCGYPAGDQLIRSISTLLDNRLRNTDFLSRIGGDSFGIIFEQCPARKAKSILNGLIEAISLYKFTWNEQVYRLSASVGLVEMSDPETNKEELLKNADTACYLAKQEGRQQVHIYHDDIHEKKIDIVEHNWLETLNKALNQDHFILFCQPILHLATETVSHFEILLRLKSKQNEIISSRSFVSDAERLNLMPKIDRWVISNALKWLKSRPSDNNTLFIKLSGQTLDITFKPWLFKQLKKAKVDASRLCFVISETVALKNINNTLEMVTSIISLGCQFSVDDFGYDIHAFSILKKLPITYIKIDGQLIKNIERNLIDKAMVKSINDIVHISGKKTIADFTSNENIKSIVRSIEIDYIQGSYSGSPVNIDTL